MASARRGLCRGRVVARSGYAWPLSLGGVRIWPAEGSRKRFAEGSRNTPSKHCAQ